MQLKDAKVGDKLHISVRELRAPNNGWKTTKSLDCVLLDTNASFGCVLVGWNESQFPHNLGSSRKGSIAFPELSKYLYLAKETSCSRISSNPFGLILSCIATGAILSCAGKTKNKEQFNAAERL